ncbi:MAG: flavodoxin family protein [Sedimentisphaerales bacterium]|nr:flavodoxin family protein [Sedimentisphaerales bacterium]
MKVVVINGSPKGDKGNTALILTPFIEGMKEAGAEVKIFYPVQMDIKTCRGEYNCWFRTPGKCFQDDDMQKFLPELTDMEIFVLATPLYVDGMSGPLKNMLDRVIPIAEPVIELRDGHCRHPGRINVKNGKLVLVSNCGFWEMDNFDALLSHVRAIGRNINMEFVGALLRPHGPVLEGMMKQGMDMSDIFDAAKDAGRQLVRDGKMSPDTLKTIGRDLLSKEQYLTIVNQFIKNALSQHNS